MSVWNSFGCICLSMILIASCTKTHNKIEDPNPTINLEELSDYDVNWEKVGNDSSVKDCALVPNKFQIRGNISASMEFEYFDCTSGQIKYEVVFSYKPIPPPSKGYSAKNWKAFTGLITIKDAIAKRTVRKRYFEAFRFIDNVNSVDIESYFNGLPDYCYSEILSSFQQEKPEYEMRVWQVFNHDLMEYPNKPLGGSKQELANWSDRVAEIDRYNYSCKESGVYIFQNGILLFVDRKGVFLISSMKLYI